MRYGLDGKLIDLGKEQELPARELIRELIEWFIGDVVDELGSRKEVEYAFKILEQGTSADRQTRQVQGNRRSQGCGGQPDRRDRGGCGRFGGTGARDRR